MVKVCFWFKTVQAKPKLKPKKLPFHQSYIFIESRKLGDSTFFDHLKAAKVMYWFKPKWKQKKLKKSKFRLKKLVLIFTFFIFSCSTKLSKTNWNLKAEFTEIHKIDQFAAAPGKMVTP
jgi:hypothetical protein